MKKTTITMALVSLTTVGAHAATTAWTGLATGDTSGIPNNVDWGNTDNWDNGVPGTGDTITVGAGMTIGTTTGNNGQFPVPNINGGSLTLGGSIIDNGFAFLNGTTVVVESTGSILAASANAAFGFNTSLVTWNDGAKFEQDNGGAGGRWQIGTSDHTFVFSAAGWTNTFLVNTAISQNPGAGNTFKVDLSNYTGATGVSYTLIDMNSAGTWTAVNMANVDYQVTGGGGVYDADFVWNETNATLSVNVTAAVPEPSSAALIGLGGFALILRRRRS